MLDLEKHAAFQIVVAEITRVPQLLEISGSKIRCAGSSPLRPLSVGHAAEQNHDRLVDAVRRGDQETRAITAESVGLSRQQLLQRIITFELT